MEDLRIHSVVENLRANPNVRIETSRSGAVDKTLPYWRTSELLRHMKGQTNEQIDESAARGRQILEFEEELRSPFCNVPEESPYYRNRDMGGTPFTIPAHLRVNQPAMTQCCAGCALKLDAMKRTTGRKEEKKIANLPAEEVTRKKKKKDTLEAIIEEPKEEDKEPCVDVKPRESRQNEAVVEVNPNEGESQIPPMYGTAELAFGLRNVLHSTNQAMNAMKNVRFIAGSEAFEYDRHLSELDHLQKSVAKYHETFKRGMQATDRLLKNGCSTIPTASERPETKQTEQKDPPATTPPLNRQDSSLSTATSFTKPERMEWGGRLDVTHEKSVTEIGPQFSNVRPEIRTKPRKTYSYEKLTAEGGGFCSAASRERINLRAKRRSSSLLSASAIRRERHRLQEERAELAIERAKWMQEKVDRRIASSDAKVKCHFRAVMQQSSDTSCWSIN